jgi:hypothetical protein
MAKETFPNKESIMPKHLRWTFALIAILALSTALSAQVASQPAQAAPAKPEDKLKIYAEIAGEYTFDMGGQTQVITFVVRDGSLYGAPANETQELLVPVKDKPLNFEVTVQSNGNFFQLEFVRDDKGVIFKCVLQAEGMTLEGLKTIK